jgi:hypothetical protein
MSSCDSMARPATSRIDCSIIARLGVVAISICVLPASFSPSSR